MAKYKSELAEWTSMNRSFVDATSGSHRKNAIEIRGKTNKSLQTGDSYFGEEHADFPFWDYAGQSKLLPCLILIRKMAKLEKTELNYS